MKAKTVEDRALLELIEPVAESLGLDIVRVRLMGGTLRAELVLALANLIWLVLMGILGWVGYSGDIAHAGWWNAVPTVALAGALVQALSLQVNWVAWASLAAWGVAAMTAAVRLFRFDG